MAPLAAANVDMVRRGRVRRWLIPTLIVAALVWAIVMHDWYAVSFAAGLSIWHITFLAQERSAPVET